jgi:hypothetical protein
MVVRYVHRFGARIAGCHRTEARQMTEVAIAVASLNRMLELGRPEYLRLS